MPSAPFTTPLLDSPQHNLYLAGICSCQLQLMLIGKRFERGNKNALIRAMLGKIPRGLPTPMQLEILLLWRDQVLFPSLHYLEWVPTKWYDIMKKMGLSPFKHSHLLLTEWISAECSHSTANNKLPYFYFFFSFHYEFFLCWHSHGGVCRIPIHLDESKPKGLTQHGCLALGIAR